VDDVILVGGQSRSPIVRRKVREFFGQEPRREVHPDEAVAIGAAQFGSSLGNTEGLVLIDALPMSIGVALPGGRFKRVIERDTKLPVARTYRLHTSRDRQTELEVKCYQGEDDDVRKNEFIGTLRVAGLPEQPKGEIGVVITFELNGECILNLSASVDGTEHVVRTRLITRATPDDAQLAAARAASIPGAPARAASIPGAAPRTGSIPGASARAASIPGAPARAASIPGASPAGASAAVSSAAARSVSSAGAAGPSGQPHSVPPQAANALVMVPPEKRGFWAWLKRLFGFG
jgi:molecular chaperone DnaK